MDAGFSLKPWSLVGYNPKKMCVVEPLNSHQLFVLKHGNPLFRPFFPIMHHVPVHPHCFFNETHNSPSKAARFFQNLFPASSLSWTKGDILHTHMRWCNKISSPCNPWVEFFASILQAALLWHATRSVGKMARRRLAWKERWRRRQFYNTIIGCLPGAAGEVRWSQCCWVRDAQRARDVFFSSRVSTQHLSTTLCRRNAFYFLPVCSPRR